MQNFLHNRFSRLKPGAALMVGAALAATGFLGVKAATPRVDNPPATVKTAPRSPETARRGYANVVKKVVPAVVNISSSRMVKNEMTGMQGFQMDPFFRQFFGNNMPFNNVPKEQREKALGSGVIVSPEGYILTNNHVIDKATDITVTLHDKREFKARVVGTDPRTDIAVLKINGSNFPYLTLGDSNQVEVGDIVLAVGDPFGVGQTVTSGIVSATNRSMNNQIEQEEDFIQTDAAINPGNSGGALVDDEGHLIGINTAIISGNSGGNQGIGFAVPVNLARYDMDQILKNGKVEHGYLGILPQDVTPQMAKAFGVTEATGVLVGDVTPDSPASRAGLQKGDIVLDINGQPVDDANALRVKVGMMTPGASVNLRVLRDNKTMNLTAQLGQFPSNEEQASNAAPGEHESMLEGVQLSTLTPEVAQQLQLGPNAKGVVVESVSQDSAAAEAGLQRGDVIQQVNHRTVTNMSEFRQAMNSTTKNNPALLLVNRQGTTLFIAI
ncbi:MAG TPA: DegQ family serine endoprotease [Bryobacteraceae bacterium]|nr:DegQ family serine endoprotease [Bryobacteraceae bacterium]